MNSFTEKLKTALYDHGADLVGFGDLSEIQSELREDMPYGISIALAIDPDITACLKTAPTREYFEAYHSMNNKLDELVEFGAKYIHDCGYLAYPRSRAVIAPFEKEFGTILPHKTVATRSGLGWIGKCALLVTEEYGSAVRISSILTDAPVDAGVPYNESKCGNCMQCADACPGKAVNGRNWDVNTARDEILDPALCKKAARDISKRYLNEVITLCGKCINVCPYTQRYLRKAIIQE